MVEQIAEIDNEYIRCIYKKGIVCYLKHGEPLLTQCHICAQRINDLTDYIIHSRFTSEKYRIHQIYPLLKKNFVTIEDKFPDPEFHCLRTVKFLDPLKKDTIMFNVFNLSQNEYYFEIFEMKLKELPEFIWFLEEFGYSEKLEKFIYPFKMVFEHLTKSFRAFRNIIKKLSEA